MWFRLEIYQRLLEGRKETARNLDHLDSGKAGEGKGKHNRHQFFSRREEAYERKQ